MPYCHKCYSNMLCGYAGGAAVLCAERACADTAA